MLSFTYTINTSTREYIHTNLHTYIDAHTNMHIHTIYTQIHNDTHTYTYMHIYIHWIIDVPLRGLIHRHTLTLLENLANSYCPF